MPKKKTLKKETKKNSKKEIPQLSQKEITQLTEDENPISPELIETPEKKQKQDKQFYYILGTMIGLIVLFLIAHTFFQSLKTFEHEGLSFTKEKMGDIRLYHYYYYTTPSYATGAAISEGNPKLINLYVRNDPRTNNIPIDGEIELKRGKSVYITINATGLTECPYSSLAIAGLSSFITENGFTMQAGVPNKAEAEKDNLDYITCEEHPRSPVILIQSGEETSIAKENNCYTITAANCEILQATEKFMIQSIIDAKARNTP